MLYVMRHKLLSMGDDFTVKDAEGQDVYFVDGRAFSVGDKLAFRDMAGNELAFIRQKLLAWGPTYEVYRGGEMQAVIKKHLFTLLRQRFTVDVEGPDDLEARGDFLDHEYTFEKRGEIVATVSKRWFTLADTYGVETGEGEDDVLILATAVVIDLCLHKQESGSD